MLMPEAGHGSLKHCAGSREDRCVGRANGLSCTEWFDVVSIDSMREGV
jgi:hypothetical protein